MAHRPRSTRAEAILPDTPQPWDDLPLTVWRDLLAHYVNETGFDRELLDDAAGDVGLSDAHKQAILRWLKHIEHEDELRARRGEKLPSTVRFLSEPVPDLSPEMKAASDKAFELLMARVKRARGEG